MPNLAQQAMNPRYIETIEAEVILDDFGYTTIEFDVEYVTRPIERHAFSFSLHDSEAEVLSVKLNREQIEKIEQFLTDKISPEKFMGYLESKEQ